TPPARLQAAANGPLAAIAADGKAVDVHLVMACVQRGVHNPASVRRNLRLGLTEWRTRKRDGVATRNRQDPQIHGPVPAKDNPLAIRRPVPHNAADRANQTGRTAAARVLD